MPFKSVLDHQLLFAYLKELLSLEETSACLRQMSELKRKKKEIDPAFYSTPAMTLDSWKRNGQSLRHAICRHAIHGFHHHICIVSGFHDLVQTGYCDTDHSGLLTIDVSQAPPLLILVIYVVNTTCERKWVP